MKQLSEFKTNIQFLLTDIDDTITTHGHLSAQAYSALEKLKKSGVHVIPVTGRPAGWCDLIARFWPVDAVIGENGGLYYRYFHNKMHRWNFSDEETLKNNQTKLKIIADEIKQKIPHAAISADQFCRVYDLAVDFCEDIPRLSDKEIESIVKVFHQHGATAKVSSIHVNGWFGNFNKVTTAKLLLSTEFNLSESDILEKCAYVGDSPNDEPLFENFEHTFGVANINNFVSRMQYLPQYISKSESGQGFCEIVDQILRVNSQT
ncbi:MAG: HAD-IIB family hydrolase [Pseudobdellovibrio sp.]